MKVEIWDVDPEVAKMLLEGNLNNRNINPNTVKTYAREMRAGRWRENGCSFSIYDDGNRIILLNGQHRLLAIVETGMTFKFVVVYEDSPEVFDTLDTGKVRSATDILKIAGFQYTAHLHVMARQVHAYHTMPDKVWDTIEMSRTEVRQWAEAQDRAKLHTASSAFTEARRRFRSTNVWYASMAYLIALHSPNHEKWMMFHEGYTWGDRLPKESPIMALRRYTENRRPLAGVSRVTTTPWDRQAHLAVGLKAWEKWLNGEESMYLRFSIKELPMPCVA